MGENGREVIRKVNKDPGIFTKGFLDKIKVGGVESYFCFGSIFSSILVVPEVLSHLVDNLEAGEEDENFITILF